MVRIRKDAITLSDGERDRFLAAFGTLNGQGTGRFADFRDMHTEDTLGESHNNWGFFQWHRCYLLDLRRQLQGIDATVTLPYWRFDQPAPQLFHPAYIEYPNSIDQVQFTPTHPFKQWTTEGVLGINRRMGFPPGNKPPGLKTETAVIANGSNIFRAFGVPFTNSANGGIEYDPHGKAHTCYRVGWITDPATAPRDPLFFLSCTEILDPALGQMAMVQQANAGYRSQRVL